MSHSRTSKGVPFLLGAIVLGVLVSGCGGSGGSGGGGGNQAPPDPALSTLTVSIPFGAPADGNTMVDIVATVVDANGDPLRRQTVQLTVTGSGNNLNQPGDTNMNGMATGRLSSDVGEVKSITAIVNPGPDQFTLGPVTTEFLKILPNEYFVRESGSDGNSGRSPLDAWRTISFALSRVGPGDTLYVGAGTYAESITVSTAATFDEPLTIYGDPEGCYTGDAGTVLVDAGGAQFGFELTATAFAVELRGFAVRGSAMVAGSGGGFYVTGASNCALVRCESFENECGVDVDSANRLTIQSSKVSNNFGGGINLDDADNSSVLQNLVYNNGGPGIVFDGNSANLTIEGNTMYRNAGDQLLESAAGSTGTVMDNVLSEGGADGLVLAAGSILTEDFNLSWAHVGSDFVNSSPAPNNFSADPLFADPFGPDGTLGGVGAADDDFRYLGGSPAFDVGDRSAADVTLSFGGPVAAMTSRVDDVMDGTSPDGNTLNLGYHYPVALDPFGNLGPFGERATFATPGDVVVRTRAWDRASNTWTPTTDTVAANFDVRWVVQRVSPLLQPEEFVAVLADTGTRTDLFVHHWDGRKWSDPYRSQVPSAIRSANADQRGFDLELEMLSGEAMLVRSNDDDNPVFRTFVDGEWSPDQQVFTSSLGTGDVLWIELVPRYGTDEIAMVALDHQANLTAAIWDGSAWTNTILVDTSVNELRDFKAFDVAWETQSGDLFVGWGYTNLIEETRFATFVASTRQWLTGQHFSTDAVGQMTVLASDPISDRVVAAFSEGDFDDDISIAVWSGDVWTHNVEIAPQGLTGSRALEVGFIGSTGRAFAIFRRQNLTGAFDFALWQPAGWQNQATPTLPGVGRVVQVEAVSVPGEDRVSVLLLDETGDLFALTYDLTNGWSILNGGSPLHTGLSTGIPTQVFSMDFRRL